MAFARAKTALAQIEEKLRRQFNLAGEVGASLQPVITPVVITGDLRDAGNAANQGRAFMWSHLGALGAGFGPYMSVRCEQDVFVDEIIITIAAAQRIQCYLTVASQSPAVAVVTLAGTWVDRKTVSTDQVPLTQGVAGARTGVDASDQNRIIGAVGTASGMVVAHRANIMLPAGSALNFETGGAMTASIRGRIWP